MLFRNIAANAIDMAILAARIGVMAAWRPEAWRNDGSHHGGWRRR